MPNVRKNSFAAGYLAFPQELYVRVAELRKQGLSEVDSFYQAVNQLVCELPDREIQ